MLLGVNVEVKVGVEVRVGVLDGGISVAVGVGGDRRVARISSRITIVKPVK